MVVLVSTFLSLFPWFQILPILLEGLSHRLFKQKLLFVVSIELMYLLSYFYLVLAFPVRMLVLIQKMMFGCFGLAMVLQDIYSFGITFVIHHSIWMPFLLSTFPFFRMCAISTSETRHNVQYDFINMIFILSCVQLGFFWVLDKCTST